MVRSRVVASFCLVLTLQTISCAAPPEYGLLAADEKSFQLLGASVSGARFIFHVNKGYLVGRCSENRARMEELAATELRARGACPNGFVMSEPRFSPPKCNASIQCKH